MATSNAATKEVFEAIITFEEQLDQEERVARAVGMLVFILLTFGMLVGGQFLS